MRSAEAGIDGFGVRFGGLAARHDAGKSGSAGRSAATSSNVRDSAGGSSFIHLPGTESPNIQVHKLIATADQRPITVSVRTSNGPLISVPANPAIVTHRSPDGVVASVTVRAVVSTSAVVKAVSV